jgi:N-methylhydantoinase A/oxoprolinase/acetone carboxylase beta subunit
VLSAFGLSLSDAVAEVIEPASERYARNGSDDAAAASIRSKRFADLAARATDQLVSQGYDASLIKVEKYVREQKEQHAAPKNDGIFAALCPPLSYILLSLSEKR